MNEAIYYVTAEGSDYLNALEQSRDDDRRGVMSGGGVRVLAAAVGHAAGVRPARRG